MLTSVPIRVAPHAFSRTLHVASRSPNVTAVADALSMLLKIVAVGAHPPGTLARIVDVARKRMTTTESAMVWQVAVALALATRDERLRSMVTEVAEGTVEPPFSARQQLGLWVRSAAQRALNRNAIR